MTVLPIIIAPDPLLKQMSTPVEAITPDILQLLEDMLDTMYAAKGVGLSAVQVGVLKRVVVMDADQGDEDEDEDTSSRGASRGNRGKPLKMLNPEIVSSGDEPNIYKEGCLSFPGQYSEVERPKVVTVKYMDETGKHHSVTMDGLAATCIQHEIDHMNGIVFVDHISRLKREMIVKRLIKAKKDGSLPSRESNPYG
jgi:peptide deformylase